MIKYCPLCNSILSTWCYMTSLHVMRLPTPSPTVCAAALWLCLKIVYIQVQAGGFYHIRDINV